MIAVGDGDLLLLGAAHDPRAGSAECRAVLAPDRTLRSLDLDLGGAETSAAATAPATAIETGGLLGRLVGRGFRAAVDHCCPPGTLASVLLCELPVAALLSGYGSLYTGQFPAPISDAFMAGLPADICAGWASPGSMMMSVRDHREIPTPDGPLAPPDRPGDWHEMAPLAPGSMRRQRLIERTGDEVWAMFRDTYARPDGEVIVLHEYSLSAALEGSRVASCLATPRVLPWLECPTAAASASRLEGHHVADLRSLVRDDLVGTSTCTHLNDLLASLSQADALV
jgi:hypothetical protein